MVRTILGCAVVAAVLGARVEIAAAGDCGGDDSDTSSFFDDDDDDDSWESSPSESTATTWTRNTYPYLVLEVGVAMRTFADPIGSQDRSIEHDGEDFAYRVVQPMASARPAVRTVLSTLRVGVTGRHGFYGAIEGELGGIVSDVPEAEMITQGALGTPSIENSHGIAYGALAVAGLRGHAGNLTLGAELAGGVRGVSYHYESHYLACEQTDVIAAHRGVVEARARAALWLSPTWNVGVQLGSSLLDRGAWMTGVYFGAHTYAYGGR